MKQPEAEPASQLHEFAEWVLKDEQRRGWYDDAKMHWIGDPDPSEREHGRHPWVKRDKNDNLYVYSQPVLAAFSIAKQSLMSIRKDPWHRDDNPDAWFVGIHNLASGRVTEPRLVSSKVSRYGQVWLQLAGSSQQAPRDQRRIEAWLQPGHYTTEASYANGLREKSVDYQDIVALESMMRSLNEASGLLLPRRLSPESDRAISYAPAA